MNICNSNEVFLKIPSMAQEYVSKVINGTKICFKSYTFVS